MANLDDLTLISCSFNTPDILTGMLQSFRLYHKEIAQMKVVIMENSTNDDTKKILDANNITYINNPGGTHSRSMDIAFDKCKTKYALVVDSDVIFRSNISELFNFYKLIQADLAGIECGSRGGFNLKIRIHPWFMLVNVDSIKKYGIKFHDEKRIIATNSTGFFNNIPINKNKSNEPMYDVGATFYEDIKNAGLKIVNLPIVNDYFFHMEGLSWQRNCGDPDYQKRGIVIYQKYMELIEKLKFTDIKDCFIGCETVCSTPMQSADKTDQDPHKFSNLIQESAIALFLNQIVQMVENKNFEEAIHFYDTNRPCFTIANGDLIQADSLIKNFKTNYPQIYKKTNGSTEKVLSNFIISDIDNQKNTIGISSDNVRFKPRLITYNDTINYADGSEKKLLEIVSDPKFDEDNSWQNKTDWAQYYHLSPLRRNVINWIHFDNKKPLRILELGAGCGAITSQLVTIPSAHVVAVEGSLDRAKVIQARCANASNLEIHACALDRYETNELFDVVTLIGVLEYAGKYEKGENPFLSVLTRAKKWLKKDGFLIVAIENQLGSKYLSGSPEDHYGVSYEGINGYPHYNGIRTFTKASLSDKLDQAGFKAQWWFYPYPDYKLPSVIFSEKAFSIKGFDWKGLISLPQEPNENSNPIFCNRSFLSLLHENGILNHFMNSFLVIASGESDCQFCNESNSHIVAIKTNVKSRKAPLHTFTEFIDTDNALYVNKRKIFIDKYLENDSIDHVIPKEPEIYHPKTVNLFDAVTDSVISGNYDKIRNYCKLWEDILLSKSLPPSPERIERFRTFAQKYFIHNIYPVELIDQWIPGCYLDLIPPNILIPQTGLISIETTNIIDLEWQLKFDIPLQLVFDRGYNHFLSKFKTCFLPNKLTTNKDSGLPIEMHKALDTLQTFKQRRLLHCQLFEFWFQNGYVNGTYNNNWNWNIVILALEKANNPKVPESFTKFMESIVQFMEKGDSTAAIGYFNEYHYLFSGEPQLSEVKNLINNIKLQLTNA